MRPAGGTLPLVAILCFYLLMLFGRASFPPREEGPAFFVPGGGGVWVELGHGFPHPGVHQFSDGTTPRSVIKMTIPGVGHESVDWPRMDTPLKTGAALSVHSDGLEIIEISIGWMPARKRVSLGVPLHPDRMVASDWEVLPGIGPRLAERIEKNRQQNGEFGSLRGLGRVRGIGDGRMRAWKHLFLHGG